MIPLRKKILCIIILAISAIIILGTVITTGFSKQYDIRIGQVCSEDIYASRNIDDIVTTQKNRDAARNSVSDVYVTDKNKTDSAVKKVNEALSLIYTARNTPVEGETPTIPQNNTYISDTHFYTSLSLSASDYGVLAKISPELVEKVMSEGVEKLSEGHERFENYLNSLLISKEVSTVATALGKGAISENKAYDPVLTETRRKEAESAVAKTTYLKNQIIARQGEIITEAQYAMLSDMGVVKGEGSIDVLHTLSVLLLASLVLALAIAYYIFIGRFEINAGHVNTTTICSILAVAGSVIVMVGGKGNWIYLMPVSMIPALISLLLSPHLAYVVNVVIATIAGIHTGDFSVALAFLLAGTATGFAFSKVRRRANLLPATIISAFAYALACSTIFIDTSKNFVSILTVFMLSLFGGFLGGILTIGTIPFWEAIFDVITPMKLGELSNPEHELLKKLLLKAPGTYHHSLTVANLAEAAAGAIGANALLARVGSYYHDIGKMENPQCFKENQLGSANIHDELPPEESASIIIHHVVAGAVLANQYRLPSAVKDIILQHHGTTTTSYFLYKAREVNPSVDSAPFTYKGPTPKRKEATIIMLADACEAAARAMREKGEVDVKKVVDNIVASRISEGQFANSSLTFSDLEKVKASFVQTLEQSFHKRIIYPQNEKKGWIENGNS